MSASLTEIICVLRHKKSCFRRSNMSAQPCILARELEIYTHSQTLAMILSIERITKTLTSPPLVCASVVRMQQSRRTHVLKGFKSHLSNVFICKNDL